MRVALDTNVLVSAAIAAGPPRGVLEAAGDGMIELVVPVQALLDLERVLIYKISANPADVRQFRDTVAELAAELAPTPEEVAAVSGDPEDDRIIAAALAARADVLVSGDSKHVLPLGAIGGMRILKPQTMLAELSRRDA